MRRTGRVRTFPLLFEAAFTTQVGIRDEQQFVNDRFHVVLVVVFGERRGNVEVEDRDVEPPMSSAASRSSAHR